MAIEQAMRNDFVHVNLRSDHTMAAAHTNVDVDLATIDISPFLRGTLQDKRRVAQRVAKACEEIGFFFVTGHGVSMALIEAAHSVVKAFFDQDVETKMQVASPVALRGYGGARIENVSRVMGREGPPDPVEKFSMGPPESNDNVFPTTPGGMRDTLETYYKAIKGLSIEIMHIFALALDLPEQFFDDKIDRAHDPFRCMSYPPLEDTDSAQLWMAEHTDVGTLTVLSPRESSTGGLEVQLPSGRWAPVVAPSPDALVVNIGDTMMRWTNDTWISTTHRVARASRGGGNHDRRQSLVFFNVINNDAIIECIPKCCKDRSAKYEPVSWEKFFAEKIAKALY